MLRGTARIGLKALFPTQGPHAACPHSYRCPKLHLVFMSCSISLLNSIEQSLFVHKNHVDGEHRCRQDFIIEAMKFHLLKGDLKLQMSLTSPRTKPRQPVGLPKVMLAIGGQAPKAIR